MRTSVRTLVATFAAILAVAASASAAVRHQGGLWQHHVRLVPLPGGGTSIHVGGRGSHRAVVLSAEAIGAAAVRDIDADGDLDIIASGGNGLVVWRNLGSGRYALAPPPGKGKLHRRFGPGIAPSRTARAFGLGEQRQQLAAAPSTLTTGVAPVIASAVPHHTTVHTPAARSHAGRAPPARA